MDNEIMQSNEILLYSGLAVRNGAPDGQIPER